MSNEKVESVEIREVSNGFVVRVVTESEEVDKVFLKKSHVIKYLKEVFGDN